MKPLFANIMVALSASDASMEAAKYAIIMAHDLGATLTAVYVVDTATIGRLALSRIFVEDEAAHFRSSLDQNGRRYLHFAQGLAESKGVQIQTSLRSGAVGPELLAAARETGCSCLVVGAPEPSRASWDLLASSYRELFYHSPCPVLVVRSGVIEERWNAL